MSLALQIVLFIACIAFIIAEPVVIVALFRLHALTEQLLHDVNQLREEFQPLIRTMGATVERLHALSAAAQQEWREVERIVQTVRSWSDRGDALVEQIASLVEPPLYAVSRRVDLWRVGLKAFLEHLLSGNQQHQEKWKETYERTEQ